MGKEYVGQGEQAGRMEAGRGSTTRGRGKMNNPSKQAMIVLNSQCFTSPFCEEGEVGEFHRLHNFTQVS